MLYIFQIILNQTLQIPDQIKFRIFQQKENLSYFSYKNQQHTKKTHMGNNKSDSFCSKSTKQQLQQSFNCFELPKSIQPSSKSSTIPPPIFENGQSITVSQNPKIKGKLYRSTYLLNHTKTNQQIEIYFMRHKLSQKSSILPFVEVHGIKQIQQSNFCGLNKFYYVITEDLILIKQLEKSMTFQHGLYALFNMVIGFCRLYQKYGYFQITEKMVAVNQKGFIRLWVNENFAENHPQNQLPHFQISSDITMANTQRERQKKQDEQIMIQQIFDILERQLPGFQQKVCQQLLPYVRNSETNHYEILNFQHLLNALSSYQIDKDQSIFIPNRLFLATQSSQSFENQQRISTPSAYDPLQPRQSFSLKLQRIREQCYQQQLLEQKAKKQQQLLKKKQQIQRKLQQSRQTSYSTGKNGNTMSQYHPAVINNVQFSYQSPVFSLRQQSVSTYIYGSLAPHNGYNTNYMRQSPYYLNNINMIESQLPQIQRINSAHTFVRQLQSNNYKTEQRNEYIYTQVTPTDHMQQKQSSMNHRYNKTAATQWQKFLGDTNFRSTTESGSYFYSPSHKVHTQSDYIPKNNSRQLNHSNSDIEWMKRQRQYVDERNVFYPNSTKNNTNSNIISNNYANQKQKLISLASSSYKQSIYSKYLNNNTSNKKNDMRISQQYQSQEQSYRQSLAANNQSFNSFRKQNSNNKKQNVLMKEKQFRKIDREYGNGSASADRNFLIKEEQYEDKEPIGMLVMETPSKYSSNERKKESPLSNKYQSFQEKRSNQKKDMLNSVYTEVNNSFIPLNSNHVVFEKDIIN